MGCRLRVHGKPREVKDLVDLRKCLLAALLTGLTSESFYEVLMNLKSNLFLGGVKTVDCCLDYSQSRSESPKSSENYRKLFSSRPRCV